MWQWAKKYVNSYPQIRQLSGCSDLNICILWPIKKGLFWWSIYCFPFVKNRCPILLPMFWLTIEIILFFVIYFLRKITSKNMLLVSVDHNICTSSWYVDFSGATNNCSSRYYHFSSPSQDAFIFLYGIRCALTNF